MPDIHAKGEYMLAEATEAPRICLGLTQVSPSPTHWSETPILASEMAYQKILDLENTQG